MRYGRERKALTRDRVLREAAAAIRVDGPDRLGVAALMGRAGLTHGGFYAHFGSKDDLLEHALDYTFEDAFLTFFMDTELRDARAVLSEYVDFYLSAEHRDGRERGCPIPILAGEAHRMPVRTRERFSAGLTLMREQLAVLLERAAIPDAAERANSALAEMVGAISMARASAPGAAECILRAARRSVREKLDIVDGDA